MTTTESMPIVSPASGVAGPPQGDWTYEDYIAIPDDGRRYEILAGVLQVAPSPNADHQLVLIDLVLTVAAHVKTRGLGKTFAAPFDVRLEPGTVVQPDLLVVLATNDGRIGKNSLDGAPDLAIEIASPGTATYDRNAKLRTYERAGVPEYWIVDPAAKAVELFVLESGAYRQVGVYQDESRVPSTILPELDVPVKSYFG